MQTAAGEARQKKTGGNDSKLLFFIARLNPRETQDRRKAFWIASSRWRDSAQLFWQNNPTVDARCSVPPSAIWLCLLSSQSTLLTYFLRAWTLPWSHCRQLIAPCSRERALGSEFKVAAQRWRAHFSIVICTDVRRNAGKLMKLMMRPLVLFENINATHHVTLLVQLWATWQRSYC